MLVFGLCLGLLSFIVNDPSRIDLSVIGGEIKLTGDKTKCRHCIVLSLSQSSDRHHLNSNVCFSAALHVSCILHGSVLGLIQFFLNAMYFT